MARWLSPHPIDLPENEGNFEQYACNPGFFKRERAVTPLLPEKEAFPLCTS